MLWIHGGAFTRGSNRIPTYDGAAFARDGVVLVAINYRLGVPGFASIQGAPENRGLLDQLFALAWVQDNIGAFGGDPGNVTIFGESAGGMSVACLLASPSASGLFDRAIVQSGNATSAADVADARLVTAQIAARLDIEPTAEEFGAVTSETMLAAQDAVGLELSQGPDPAHWGRSILQRGLGVMSLFPTVDGDVIPQLPLDAVAAGAGRGVSLIAGTNVDEFRFFLVPTGIAALITPEALTHVVTQHGWDTQVIDKYTRNRPGASPGDVLAAIMTDGALRAGTIQLADAHARHGSPTYLYEFDWHTPIQDLRACHALELPFVFDQLQAASAFTGPTPPQNLADEMHSAWVSFAKNGDPGWPAYDESRPIWTFGAPQSVTVRNPRSDELAFWSR